MHIHEPAHSGFRATYRGPLTRISMVIASVVVAIWLMWPSRLMTPALAVGPTYIPGGVITTVVTWTLSHSPYIVQGNLTIDTSGQLIIEPGVEVRLADGVFLDIYGQIHAIGTSSTPVTFTTASTVTVVPGRWSAIRFWNGSTGSLQQCIVNSAGYGNWAAVTIYSSNILLDGCRVHDNQSYGIYADGADPELYRTLITHNGNAGLVTINAVPIVRSNCLLSKCTLRSAQYDARPGGERPI